MTCVVFGYFYTNALLGISENIAQLFTPLMPFELRIEKKRDRDRNRVRQTDLLTGNVVLLLSERVQVLDRSNYGCFLAASKKHCHSVEVQPENGFTLIQSLFQVLQYDY